jgi:hypothetical protein
VPSLHVWQLGCNVRAHAAGIPHISTQLLGEADLLQTEPIHAGKRAKYLLAVDERGGFARNGFRERFIFARICGAVDEKQVLLGRPDNDVQFPLPAEQILYIGPGKGDAAHGNYHERVLGMIDRLVDSLT